MAARPHIGIFGLRNNGKSSLINCLVGQEVAIVSPVPGTTTDPVRKTMEIHGIGPVVLIDTAGIDDLGDLGEKRISKTRQVLKTIDLAILVISENQFTPFDENLIAEFKHFEVPFFIVHTKSDIQPVETQFQSKLKQKLQTDVFDFSIFNKPQVADLIALLQKHIPETSWKPDGLIDDLISAGDVVMLIVPIDSAAPEGRLILPQVQLIRNVLDNDAVAVVCKENNIREFYQNLQPKPKLVVTDSQVFEQAVAELPQDVALTSFSIILARQKGDFQAYLKGTPHIGKLKSGDRVLILESCSHHASCEDIGRVKIPNWLNRFTQKQIDFDVVAGLNNIPRPLTDYAMVIQCGACMITRKQLINRLRPAMDQGIPVSNYGMAIAFMHGIFERATKPFRT